MSQRVPGGHKLALIVSWLLGMLFTSQGYAAPTVTLVTPVNGTSFIVPATVSLTANASESSGSIAKVDFYQGNTLLKTVTTPPYAFNWANVPPGSYTLTAKATNNQSITATSAAINITMGTGSIGYSYDQAGRLAGVISSTASTKYDYDVVGNITSIKGYAANTPSVLAFSPAQGLAGTSVTIDGNNFSSTVGQNTVLFNGTPASTIALDPTYPNRITAIVPSGATTGPISVTTPSGSDTSTANFTIVANQAPIITSLTPTIGVAGTAVAISGSNFLSDKFKEKTILNTRLSTIDSANTGSISMTVPVNTMGGKISVGTAYGTAISVQDLFVPPPPLIATDIQYMDRIDFGASKTVSITTGSKKALLLFDAAQNQRFYLNLTGGTFSACYTVTIYTPSGNILSNFSQCSSTGYIDTTTLPTTGTYTILINPTNNAVGNVTLTLYSLPPDPVGTINIDGQDVTLTTTTAGQNGSLTFTGIAGQRIYLSTPNSTYLRLESINVYKPDASGNASIGNGSIYSSSWSTGSYTDTLTLPISGTYTIYLNPSSTDTGSMTFHLISVPADVKGTISIDGSDASLTTTAIGQNGSLTFNGIAGQRIYLSSPNFTYPRIVSVNIFKPDASGNASTISGSIFFSSWSAGSNTDARILPITGTYTIFVDPSGADTGSLTFHLTSVPPDVTGIIAIDGTNATLTTTAAGQNGSLTFSGTAGQRIFLSAPNSTYPRIESVYIYKPDASGNASISNGSIFEGSWSTGSNTDTRTLPITGTYTIYLDPNSADVGSMTFHLVSVPADATGTISIDGADVTLTTTVAGQNGSLTFSGTAGQRVYLSTPNSIYPRNEPINVYKPAASGNASTSNGSIYGGSWSAGSNTDTLTLPTTGTYTIYLDPSSADTGSMTFHLTSVPTDVAGSITINGPAWTATTTAEGQNASATFNGTSGQSVTVHLASNSMGYVWITLKKPDNTTITSNSSSSISFNLPSQVLSINGVYTIYIDPSAASVGSINVSVTNP